MTDPPVGKDAALIGKLRSWPAITQGDALSVSTAALLMEEAADRLSVMEEALRKIERGTIDDAFGKPIKITVFRMQQIAKVALTKEESK